MRKAKQLKIQDYITESGIWVVKEWVNSLRDMRARSVIQRRIFHLQFGNLGDYKYLGQGIYEMRIHYAQGFRLYFGKVGDVIIVLLCAGEKRTQKQDIIKAQNYWQNFKKKNYE